jgi:hypothetical protein
MIQPLDSESLSGYELNMTETRNFVLREKKGKEAGVYTGHQPRQAALKAANRSKGTKSKPVELRLRERGTKKIHIFKGWTEVVSAPKNKPKWMPAKINKPNVKKVGVESLNKV